TSKIYLYQDGIAIGNASKTSNWDGTGALQAGRGYANNAWTGFWNGRVDDVRVYDRALSATEVANLADSTAASKYDFSEGSGTTSADAGYKGNTVTLGSATSWVNGHVGKALSMSNSSNGYAAGVGPSMRTDK